MGMYSSLNDSDITAKNRTALMKIKQANDKLPESKKNNWLCMITKDGNIDFESWHERKIEGYWYEECIEALWKIAPFVEGFVEFQYEEGYAFRIVFEGGLSYFQKGEVNWNKIEKSLIEKVGL